MLENDALAVDRDGRAKRALPAETHQSRIGVGENADEALQFFGDTTVDLRAEPDPDDVKERVAVGHRHVDPFRFPAGDRFPRALERVAET